MGTFDYAHLRVPLPKDLKDSGIFMANKPSAQSKDRRELTFPESYFLMVRDQRLALQLARPTD